MDSQDTKMDDMKATKYGIDELGRNSEEKRYMTGNYKRVFQAWLCKKRN